VASATPAELAKKLEHLLGRKQKALDEVRTALSDTTPWAELGEHLKAYGETDLPPNWRVLLDARQSRAANIERCFAKAKQQLRKEGGHRERLQALELECLHLQQLREQQDWEQIAKALAPQPTRTRVKASDAVRMRTLTSAHGFVFNWGKSARDNLQLLRAARPWDLWMHLRDYPGAHGLLRRERDQVVPRSDLEECARALLRHTLSTKTLARAGDKFDVLCVERRFVRPIKGDALGRVHYSNEQVLSIVLNP
jgi:predicted ribosome quality control (RQC) complex YloA/Tae2 family protein